MSTWAPQTSSSVQDGLGNKQITSVGIRSVGLGFLVMSCKPVMHVIRDISTCYEETGFGCRGNVLYYRFRANQHNFRIETKVSFAHLIHTMRQGQSTHDIAEGTLGAKLEKIKYHITISLRTVRNTAKYCSEHCKNLFSFLWYFITYNM